MTNSSRAEEAHKYTNRLIKEKSPYLLQHAHNPVDWHSWGEEAFAKAKSEDKAVILSIGYSTCHWCHVMEEESFENPEIAALMNQHFVSIKVDREERPDLDAVYMNYVMATTGSGGWPMTVFLTPEKKPFYGGTYFPPADRFGITGFPTLLRSIADAWQNRKEEILKSADSAAAFLQNERMAGGGVELTEAVLRDGFESYAQRFDEDFGGFGQAPKFPMGHSLSFLLRVWHRTKEELALKMAEKTLQAMADGGMHDQIGGGFHRYSTDRQWFLPHFEKMLYDQALLVRAYLEAYQATRKEAYAETARGILDYVLREMTSPEGAFFSAQDADSGDPDDPQKKREGAFYVWKKSEIDALLPGKDAEIFSFAYGVRENGNVEQDPHKEFAGQNVLHAANSAAETASHFKIGADEARQSLERSKAALLQARAKRPPLHLDDKVLTDWNGLMIASFSMGARVLNEPRYAEAAARAADFISKNLKDKNQALLHRYRDGEAALTAHLDDYAFLIYGYLELYQANFDERWAKEAGDWADEMIDLFWDEKNGGFFMTSRTAEALITRPKEDTDGALPSGNSVAALDLLLLNRITLEAKYLKYADRTLKVFSGLMSSQPAGFTQMLTALDFAIGPSYEIVIAPAGKGLTLEETLAAIYAAFLPNKVVLLNKAGPQGGFPPIGGKTAVYVCRNYACELPVTDLEALKKALMYNYKRE